jgi:hypothetical protein
MKRTTLVTVGALVFFMLCVFSFSFINPASAQYGEDVIVSFQSNSGWILNTATRKLMFFKYIDNSTVWTTNPSPLPSNIDLSNCILKAVGSRGKAVFLYDRTNHMVWFFEAHKSRSIRQYVNFNAQTQTK